ncbi:hypothetical protein [Erwinia mallotivora]|uniref:Uncharacterized protein n=1 Tax=Erwinia mallotivora TaxID=69222 RepID=A0A014ND65_9GAMM|nr:hypothetical protein [Erwinia mallotivora]EXU75331.1 hypothetical protein BG55_11780 [Erwinia mallotivora]EXU76770.1 hypothetical protein BG55_03845 [Erwinia mallotivora]EXU77353.1 hypothetical protein BG55_00420 [Erwinia mallotivora]
MNKLKYISQEEKLILLLQKYVERLKESGFGQEKIIRYIWLFCVGYYIKYYLPINQNNKIDSFTIIAMLSNALINSTDRLVEHLGYEHELTFLFRYLIHYVINNNVEAESIYSKERAKYEKALLSDKIHAVKKKRKGRRL